MHLDAQTEKLRELFGKGSPFDQLSQIETRTIEFTNRDTNAIARAGRDHHMDSRAIGQASIHALMVFGQRPAYVFSDVSRCSEQKGLVGKLDLALMEFA